MKHAGSDALDRLEPVLGELRKIDGLREKKRGLFYRGSTAFLHFHEDPAGFFADMRVGDDFERFSVNNRREIAALISRAYSELKS